MRLEVPPAAGVTALGCGTCSQVFTGSLEKMAPEPLRSASVVVPWPGHWHLHLGSRYFSEPFDANAHRAARQYLAMESLKVHDRRCPGRGVLQKRMS